MSQTAIFDVKLYGAPDDMKYRDQHRGRNIARGSSMSFTFENLISYGLVAWMVTGFILMGLNVW